MIRDERESRQTAPLFVTHAFLIKAWQVEAGAVWGRGFLPLILKTKHKKDLRGKGILNAKDQASWNPGANTQHPPRAVMSSLPPRMGRSR